MRFAIEFAGAGATADPRILGELAHIAEESGWDGMFLEDYVVHHKRPGMPTCDPWIALAAMATRTHRVRLGTEVTALPRRRPWKLAREVATLDHLSEGRMVLGVGLGDVNDAGFAGVGESTETSVRAQLVDESLAIIDGLWKGEPFSFSGRHYRLEELTFLPKPLQQPRVPIWVGGGWPNPGLKRRAARWDGICAYIETDGFDKWEDHSPRFVQDVKGQLERAGRSPAGFDIVTGGRTRGDDWDEDRAVISALDEAGATWWVEYVDSELELGAQQQAAARGPLRPSSCPTKVDPNPMVSIRVTSYGRNGWAAAEGIMSAIDTRRAASPRLLAALLLGAAIAIVLGTYGRIHDPTGRELSTLFFSSTINLKVWFASAAGVVAPVPACLGAEAVRNHSGKHCEMARPRSPQHRQAGVSVDRAGRLSLPLVDRVSDR